MADPFVGEIRILGCSFAPRGWATCEGQLLPISQNTALFSVLGMMYGGDGRSTFALPDLRGRAPMMWGDGPGLTDRSQGQAGGAATVTLDTSQMPAHNHRAAASTLDANSGAPAGNVAAISSGGTPYRNGPLDTALDPQTLGMAGADQPHDNRQPFLVLQFCIALQGVYPPRP